MTTPRSVASPDAPAAIGPYVQAIVHAGVLYCSGSLHLDPVSGALDNQTTAHEARRSLANLDAVCHEAGTSLARALRLGVYTTRLDDFTTINEAYAEFFEGRQVPARTTIGVAALPLGATVEIDAIVALD